VHALISTHERTYIDYALIERKYILSAELGCHYMHTHTVRRRVYWAFVDIDRLWSRFSFSAQYHHLNCKIGRWEVLRLTSSAQQFIASPSQNEKEAKDINTYPNKKQQVRSDQIRSIKSLQPWQLR
jgi:hypothetical protein